MRQPVESEFTLHDWLTASPREEKVYSQRPSEGTGKERHPLLPWHGVTSVSGPDIQRGCSHWSSSLRMKPPCGTVQSQWHWGERRSEASHRGHTPLWASGLRDNKLPYGLSQLELSPSITSSKMTLNRCRGVCLMLGAKIANVPVGRMDAQMSGQIDE